MVGRRGRPAGLGASGAVNVNACPSREKKKKKVPAVPETLKKKRRNFAELKIKRLRKKFAQKMVSQRFLFFVFLDPCRVRRGFGVAGKQGALGRICSLHLPCP